MQSSKHLTTPQKWLAHHDRLLFLLAYPQSRKQYDDAVEEMQRLAGSINTKLSSGNSRFHHSLSGSGVAGSTTTGSFSFAIAKWLAENFPGDTEIDSSSADAETIRLFFRALLPRTEYENISAGEWSLVNRIRKLKGKAPGTALGWLLQLLDASGLPDRIKESLFHSLQLFIRWELHQPAFNRTGLRGLITKPFYHKEMIRQAEVKKVISKKIPLPKKLLEAERTQLVNAARSTLAFLYRETEPFTYADSKEITCFELERGLTIALYGMDPERRLSIESYIGYLAFKNGIPVAYGGGWIFGHRCQFGINILPPFRGGESALLFYQLLRVYKQYYKAELFVVKPYQFGKNNREALQSGAFWFYYKAGFRPENEKLRRLAGMEWEKKQKNKLHRTSIPLLKELTGSNLLLEFKKNAWPKFDPSLVSQKISAYINKQFNGQRDKAVAACLIKTKKQLGLSSLAGWDHYQKKALQEWGLLVQAVMDPGGQSKKDKDLLIRLIRSKGSAGERKFIRLLQEQRFLWKGMVMDDKA